MTEENRQLIRDFYIRVCSDGGFQIPFERAAAFTGEAFLIHPLEVWAAFPSMDDMKSIAVGKHRMFNKQ